MARTPIDLVDWNLAGFNFYGNPIGYISEESGAKLGQPQFGAADPGEPLMLKNTRPVSGYFPDRLCCVVQFELTVRYRPLVFDEPNDPYPGEEEVTVYDYGFYGKVFTFYRAGMFWQGWMGYGNPFQFVNPLIYDENQYRGIYGNYELRTWRIKAIGHKIPFKLYYTVNKGLLASPYTETAEDEQHITFSRDAGWEQPLSWEVAAGYESWLTDVRIAPLPA